MKGRPPLTAPPLDSAHLDRLEAQAIRRIEAYTTELPGITTCVVTPHELLALVRAAREVPRE